MGRFFVATVVLKKSPLFAARMPPAGFCTRYEKFLIIIALDHQFPFCKERRKSLVRLGVLGLYQ